MTEQEEREELWKVYCLGYEHGKAYAEMKSALNSMPGPQKEDSNE